MFTLTAALAEARGSWRRNSLCDLSRRSRFRRPCVSAPALSQTGSEQEKLCVTASAPACLYDEYEDSFSARPQAQGV